MNENFDITTDVVIVGSGPAGLAAGSLVGWVEP